MTIAEYITRMFNRDFTLKERDALARPVASVSEMSQGDRIKIHGEMLDYLRDFQNSIYNGEEIPKVFGKVLIEVDGLKDKILRRVYVTFPENKPGWIYIDLFLDWLYIGKAFYRNERLPESARYGNTGRYYVYTPVILPQKGHELPTEVIKALFTEARDFFTYAFWFVWANKENPDLFKEEERKVTDSGKGKKAKKKKHHAKLTPPARDTVHVPTRRVYTVKPVDMPKLPNAVPQGERTYHVSEWPVRGYTRRITKKDGTVEEIAVRPHARRRRKNITGEGVVKQPGKDYILHERPLKGASGVTST